MIQAIENLFQKQKSQIAINSPILTGANVPISECFSVKNMQLILFFEYTAKPYSVVYAGPQNICADVAKLWGECEGERREERGERREEGEKRGEGEKGK